MDLLTTFEHVCKTHPPTGEASPSVAIDDLVSPREESRPESMSEKQTDASHLNR
jgi:hypothetical protein